MVSKNRMRLCKKIEFLFIIFFSGICGAIIINPLGPLKYFAFFCDSVCNYNDAPPNIENLLQNIISSYKELLANRWYEYFTSFPEKLRTKMKDRFTFLNI